MNSERRCDQPGCASAATKHLNYMQSKGVEPLPDGTTALPFDDKHLDLCDEHLPEVRTQFGGRVLGLTDRCSPVCTKEQN